jgi:hypothetical protein
VSRRLASYLLEDAVRYFAGVPALDLSVTVVTHNGSAGDLRLWWAVPPAHDLVQTAAVNSPGRQLAQAWLPRLEGFLANFYVREPDWSAAKPGGTGVAPSSAQDEAGVAALPPGQSNGYWSHQAHGRALQVAMHKVEACLRAESTVSAGKALDFCHVTFHGPAGSLPVEPSPCDGGVLAFLHRFAARGGISYVLCDEKEALWRSHPRWSQGPERQRIAPLVHEAYDLRPPHESPIRRTAWDHLLDGLRALK